MTAKQSNVTALPARTKVQLPEAAQKIISGKIAAKQAAEQELLGCIASMAAAVGIAGPFNYDPSCGMLTVAPAEAPSPEEAPSGR